MTLEQWLAIASTLLTIVALTGTWLGWRRAELRRGDVLAWGLQGVDVLQTILLLCRAERAPGCDESRLEDCRLKASILVEQGRLFFRNAPPFAYGRRKHSAYQGLRPCILDHLVTGFDIASALPSASEADRVRMRRVAEDCSRQFVSLLQKEVGRSRTASAATGAGGRGASLKSLMDSVDADI